MARRARRVSVAKPKVNWSAYLKNYESANTDADWKAASRYNYIVLKSLIENRNATALDSALKDRLQKMADRGANVGASWNESCVAFNWVFAKLEPMVPQLKVAKYTWTAQREKFERRRDKATRELNKIEARFPYLPALRDVFTEMSIELNLNSATEVGIAKRADGRIAVLLNSAFMQTLNDKYDIGGTLHVLLHCLPRFTKASSILVSADGKPSLDVQRYVTITESYTLGIGTYAVREGINLGKRAGRPRKPMVPVAPIAQAQTPVSSTAARPVRQRHASGARKPGKIDRAIELLQQTAMTAEQLVAAMENEFPNVHVGIIRHATGAAKARGLTVTKLSGKRFQISTS